MVRAIQFSCTSNCDVMCLYIEPGGVTNLVCAPPGGELSFSWSPPSSDQNPDSVNGYLVEVQQYVQPEGTATLSLVPLVPPVRNVFSRDTSSTRVTNAGIGECYYDYNIIIIIANVVDMM